MSVLGYERGIQYTNDMANRNRALQSNIQSINQLRNQTAKSVSQSLNKSLQDQAKKSSMSGAEGSGAEFLNDARNIYKQGKAIQKIAVDTKKNVDTALKGVDTFKSVSTELNPARQGRLYSDAQRVLSEGLKVNTSSRLASDLSDTINTGRKALSTLQEGAQSTLRASDISSVLRGGDKIVSGFSEVSKVVDSVGKLGEGVGAISGVSDIISDTGGGFAKKNIAEKVGNIAGIAGGAFSVGSLAGSLESVGTVLDATGIGAEIGIGLNVAGAVAGGVSAVADYVGGKKKQKPQVKTPAPTPTPQVSPQTSVLQSGGVATSSYN